MIYEELDVYKETYSFLLRTYRDMGNLPRDLKYGHLCDMREDLYEILALIYDANSTKDKVPYIKRARRLVTNVKIRLRILRDLGAISHGLHVELSSCIVNISRQLSSWENYVNKSCR